MGTLESGSVVADKYVVEGVIGEGGMGTVFAARHLHLDQRVAIKVLHKTSPEAIARFLREARALGQLANEHVVRVSDVTTLETGEPMLVMERLEGNDLAHVSLPADIRSAVEWVRQAALGVAAAHAAGVIHRDLKPANLFLVEREGRPLVKVLDFGIAKTEPESSVSLTSTSAMLGSPLYMSPEQVRSPRDVDVRSDVWSLGVILYELLAGKPPFSGESQAAVGASVVADRPASLRAVRPEVSRTLERVVARCLEKRPEDRFQSAEDLAFALRRTLSKHVSRRAPLLLGGLAALLVLAAVVLHDAPRPIDTPPVSVDRQPNDIARAVVETHSIPALPVPSRATVATATAIPAPPTSTIVPALTTIAPITTPAASKPDLLHDPSLVLRK